MIDTAKSGAGTAPSEREEIEMLLPWYVTGRLDPEDVRKVEDYLARHPEMAAQLELIEEERFQSTMANEAIPTPSPAALDRLLADVAGSETPPRAVSAGGGMIDQLRNFFAAPTAGAVKWASALAVALVLAQAVTIGSLVMNQGSGQNYETASGGAANARQGTFALVRFKDAATANQIAATLSALEAVIVDGPKPGGLYRVRIDRKELADAERDARLAALRARSDVFLLVTASK